MDSPSPALAMLRLTTAVLALGLEVAAGDLRALADAEALADLMEGR